MENLQKEYWIQLKNYEGLYEISNCSRIKSLDRIVKGANNINRLIKGKILKPSIGGSGYMRLPLSKNGIKKEYILHTLIAQHFIPNQLNLKYVDHINGNKLDNRIENIRYVTQSVNVTKGYYEDGNHICYRTSIKAILQYTVDGIFIAEHKSVSIAQRLFTPNSAIGSINDNLHKRNKTAYGFIWKFKL